ncbi:MAG: type transport system ATP-binding protein [Rhodospirillaceae bacterium]|nr:type transport system ATP-binding protein [Rhodospirillaceae bacterium]
MLEARELTKSYSSLPAVTGVTFCLEPGQVLGCLGPNGSGKSTTVKMLTGLLEPTRGKVLFNGEDIWNDLIGFRKYLGYVPEEPNLYPYLSGREYLELVGTLRGDAQWEVGEEDRFTSRFVLAPLSPARIACLILKGNAALIARGHKLRTSSAWSLGSNAGIVIDPSSGVLSSGADPRVEAYAWSW